ncbi:MAG: enoyl-ACP reductase [Acidobacteriia bacterium]|nr:enoyl-ACP reductase [Terriglobia bacterium]
MQKLMEGKKGLVVGVANKRSIAWAIAQACADEGAQLALTFQGERLEDWVRELAETLADPPLVLPCDVLHDPQIRHVFDVLEEKFGGLDFLVHSVAFALKDDLDGRFVDTSREGWRIAQQVSAYSLIALSKYALPLMKKNGGSIITMTYLGSQRVIPHYNIMGVAKASLEATVRYLAADLGPHNIRVNAISAGPIKTLAAMGIGGFSRILDFHREHAPLRRNTEASEVGDTGLFLASSLSRGITGTIIYVDGGYHILGA